MKFKMLLAAAATAFAAATAPTDVHAQSRGEYFTPQGEMAFQCTGSSVVVVLDGGRTYQHGRLTLQRVLVVPNNLIHRGDVDMRRYNEVAGSVNDFNRAARNNEVPYTSYLDVDNRTVLRQGGFIQPLSYGDHPRNHLNRRMPVRSGITYAPRPNEPFYELSPMQACFGARGRTQYIVPGAEGPYIQPEPSGEPHRYGPRQGPGFQ